MRSPIEWVWDVEEMVGRKVGDAAAKRAGAIGFVKKLRIKRKPPTCQGGTGRIEESSGRKEERRGTTGEGVPSMYGARTRARWEEEAAVRIPNACAQCLDTEERNEFSLQTDRRPRMDTILSLARGVKNRVTGQIQGREGKMRRCKKRARTHVQYQNPQNQHYQKLFAQARPNDLNFLSTGQRYGDKGELVNVEKGDAKSGQGTRFRVSDRAVPPLAHALHGQ